MKSKSPSVRQTQGFALVATLLLMILLVVIAMGMLSVSSISLRSATQEMALAEARANARFGMMLAIGQIQEQLGRDQSVSANAAMFDEDPASPKSEGISGVANPHWLGVFSPLNPGDGRFFIRRPSDSQPGADVFLYDSRYSDSAGNPLPRATGSENSYPAGKGYDRTAPYNVTWLVSDPNRFTADLNDDAKPSAWEPGLATADPKARPGKDDKGVVLYPKVTASGSGYTPASMVNAVAPIVPVANGNGSRKGYYAYLVSDNSQKFKVNPQHVGDPTAAEKKAPQDYTRLKTPSDVHLEGTAPVLNLDKVKVTPQNAGSIVSLPTLAFLAKPALDEPSNAFLRPLQHSLTSDGYGLFTNTVVGGMRKNLTAFLETEGTDTKRIKSPGTGWKNDDAISDYQPILASLTDQNSTPQDSIANASYGLPDSVNPGSRSVSFAALTRSTDTEKHLLWFSPVMGQLRDYVQLARDADRYGSGGSVSLPSADPASAQMTPRAGSGDGGAIDDRNSSVAGLKAPQTTWDAATSSLPNTNTISHVSTESQAPRSGYHPVITKAALYFHLAYDDENKRIVYLIYPRVELYNPYNVTMKGMTYIISIADMMNFQLRIGVIRFRDAAGVTKTANPTGTALSCNLVTNPTVRSDISPPLVNSEFVFVLEAQDIPPGKTLLFRPDRTAGDERIGGGTVPKYHWERSGTMAGVSIRSMSLTADTSKLAPDDNSSCFWIEPNTGNYKNIPADWEPVSATGANNSSNAFDKTGAARYTKLYMVRNGASIPVGYHGNYITNSADFPLLQMQCTMQPRDYHVWTLIPDPLPPLEKVTDAVENVNAKRLFWWTTGIRWGKFEESDLYINHASTRKELPTYPLLAQYNIRAPYSSMFVPVGAGGRFSLGQAIGGNDHDFKMLPWPLPLPMNNGVGEDPLNLGNSQANYAIPSNGANTVNPFFRTGTSGNITATPLFEVARESLPILSLAEFRNVPLLPFVQFPTYLIGESQASVFAPRTQTTYSTGFLLNDMYAHNITTIRWKGSQYLTGPNQYKVAGDLYQHAGYTNPYMKYKGADTWIAHNYFQAYDASYELNYSLWDRYFLTGLIGDHSGGSGSQAAGLLTSAASDPSTVDPTQPLRSNNSLAHNPRIVPNPYANGVKKEDVVSYHQAGANLLLDGAFNVNSTDPLAWQALLLSFRGVESPSGSGPVISASDKTTFSRLLYPHLNSSLGQPQNVSDRTAWQALRSLTDAEIRTLAESIVEQVKRRGPFISLSDFVNRRLVGGNANSFGAANPLTPGLDAATFPTEPRLGLAGPLQAALDSIDYSSQTFSGKSMNNFLTANDGVLTVASTKDNVSNHTQHNPIGRGAYMPGHLTQGDLLSKIGSALTVRGDTYTIRSYGDSRDPSGKITAHARCEAVIQRLPEYIEATSASGVAQEPQLEALDPGLSAINRKFGRKFIIVSFRWIPDTEIN